MDKTFAQLALTFLAAGAVATSSLCAQASGPTGPLSEERDTTEAVAPAGQTTTNVRSVGSNARKFELFPQISVLSLGTFVTNNGNFRVTYSDNFIGLPMASLGVVRPLGRGGDFAYYGMARVGYAYKAGSFSMRNHLGEQQSESMKMHWMPVSLGARVNYEIPGIPFIQPSLAVGAGAHWILQNAVRPSAREHFLVPYFYITPAITLTGTTSPDDWFGGTTFGISYLGSPGGSTTVRGFSFDLGFRVLL